MERCFYALVNEGFRCLEEGIAEHPDDIDVVWAYGYAWPGWRGGPMFWADEIGARTLVRQMVSTVQQQYTDDIYRMCDTWWYLLLPR